MEANSERYRWLKIAVLVLGLVSLGVCALVCAPVAFAVLAKNWESLGGVHQETYRTAAGCVLGVLGLGFLASWVLLRRKSNAAKSICAVTSIAAVLWCMAALVLLFQYGGADQGSGFNSGWGRQATTMIEVGAFALANVYVLRNVFGA